ncbi:MAG TPA: four-carbon acid sugar kinase family protein [Chitinophagaceae bacterium]|jgi:uncharacterized protein YgbK (DUF1537 family)
MIAVIADDFTGAAELGGIGLRYGLSVEINTAVNPAAKADLLIIAADTRSTDEATAVKEMETITNALLQLKPKLIYKKTDSVLRGHIIAEITAQLKTLGLNKALLVAANPALGRTIVDGIYLLNGQPIHQSSFSSDPEFPISSSDARDMLRTKDSSVKVKKNNEALPTEGIIVGEVKDAADLKAWATDVDNQVFLAGASGFFTAVLDTLQLKGSGKTALDILVPGQPTLFVCGTSFHKSRDRIKKISDAGGPVSYMPEEMATIENKDKIFYDAWCKEVITMIRTNKKAIIAIRPADVGQSLVHASILRQRMANAVRVVLEGVNIRELFIEGGSTAYAVLQQTGFTGFIPVEEMAPGVIRMKVQGNERLYITVKPGSYDWPAAAGDFNTAGNDHHNIAT